MNPLYFILFLLAITIGILIVLVIKISRNKPELSNSAVLEVKDKELELLKKKVEEKEQ